MHFSFNMSLSPVALSTKNTLPACQLGQKGLAQEERLQKKKTEKKKEKKNWRASVVCNAICCFRWQRVSKWESCEVSGF